MVRACRAHRETDFNVRLQEFRKQCNYDLKVCGSSQNGGGEEDREKGARNF